MENERVERRAEDKDAIARFIKIESQLVDMVESYAKLKKGLRWLLGLLAANWVITASDFIGSMMG